MLRRYSGTCAIETSYAARRRREPRPPTSRGSSARTRIRFMGFCGGSRIWCRSFVTCRTAGSRARTGYHVSARTAGSQQGIPPGDVRDCHDGLREPVTNASRDSCRKPNCITAGLSPFESSPVAARAPHPESFGRLRRDAKNPTNHRSWSVLGCRRLQDPGRALSHPVTSPGGGKGGSNPMEARQARAMFMLRFRRRTHSWL